MNNLAEHIRNNRVIKEIVIEDMKIPVGSEVSEGLNIFIYPKEGHTVTFRGAELQKSMAVVFYPSGELKSIDLKDKSVIDGLKLWLQVTFHKNGKLAAGSLVEEKEINGIKFRQPSRIEFYQNGNLKRATNIAYKKGEHDQSFFFTKEGKRLKDEEEFLKYCGEADPREL